MQVTQWKLEDLKPYSLNANEHPEEQVKKIAESIVQYGFLVPLIITPDGEIVAGHGRHLAAQYLQRKEVPCIVVDNLSPEQVRGLRIADNKVAESGWNMEALKVELESLQLLEVYTGFSPAEVEILLHPPEIVTDDSHGSGSPVISYTIVFDDQEQQEEFFSFLKHLKQAYPHEDTTAAKILSFLHDHADVSATDGDA